MDTMFIRLLMGRCWAAAGLLVLGCLPPQMLPAVEKPTGVFSSSGAMRDDIYQHPQLRGVLVRVAWKSVEVTPGKFDFSLIDQQVRRIESEGRNWSLAVIAGGTGSPAWLTESEGAAHIAYSFRGKPGFRLPLFWDAVVQDRLASLASALADKYGENPRLALVYVPQMTANGIEGHLQGVSMTVLKEAGYTDPKWIDAVKSAARGFAKAFKGKALAVEVHEVNGGAVVPGRIINELWTDPDLEQRVGAGVWWLSGRTNYQSDLIEVLTKYPGDIYAQVIGNSGQVHRFAEDGYAGLFTQAREMGVRYIEPWEYEFASGSHSAAGAWDREMQEFNRWADSTYLTAQPKH